MMKYIAQRPAVFPQRVPHMLLAPNEIMTTNLTENVLKEPVTRHLRRDFACFLPGQTVAEALEQMRQHPPEGRIIYIFVVDGVHSLQRILRSLLFFIGPFGWR